MYFTAATRGAASPIGCGSTWNCGATRAADGFLDVAERLLLNQYAANQCPNGGYGWRAFDGEAAGPVGTHGGVEEWPWCCDFHGPLGLHFLRAYLAAASERGVFVNFPLDFRASLHSSSSSWRVAVRPCPQSEPTSANSRWNLAPSGTTTAGRTTLWLRRPPWATAVNVAGPGGETVPFALEHGYVKVAREFKAGEPLRVAFHTGLRVEYRGSGAIRPELERLTRLQDVALLDGPEVLFATPAPASGRLCLLAQVDAHGQLGFWELPQGGWVTVALPSLEAGPGKLPPPSSRRGPLRSGPSPACTRSAGPPSLTT